MNKILEFGVELHAHKTKALHFATTCNTLSNARARQADACASNTSRAPTDLRLVDGDGLDEALLVLGTGSGSERAQRSEQVCRHAKGKES